MSIEQLKDELETESERLKRSAQEMKRLQVELKQTQMVIAMLEAAGFIEDGKLDEAREFVQQFYSN